MGAETTVEILAYVILLLYLAVTVTDWIKRHCELLPISLKLVETSSLLSWGREQNDLILAVSSSTGIEGAALLCLCSSSMVEDRIFVWLYSVIVRF